MKHILRFGIMSSQLGLLNPNLLTNQNQPSILGEYTHAKLIQKIVEFGFELIELSGDLSLFLPDFYTENALQELMKVKRELGLHYTVHLPLWSIEPSTPVRSVRDGSILELSDHIKRMEEIEPEVYVMHATGALASEFCRMDLPEKTKEIILRQFQANAIDSIQQIISNTGIQSRRIAIETIEFPFDKTFEIADELDLSICFDTGHVLVGFSGPIDFFDALDLSYPRLAEIHLHDGPWQGHENNIGYGQDHQTIGNGDLDTERFLYWLFENSFSGPVIFELPLENAIESFKIIQNLSKQF